MAGIKDVAKMAGVGVGTVSRMLNDSGYVSLDTRAKIEAAMKELNYTPNELARNLYYKKSGIIAVLVPNSLDESEYSKIHKPIVALDRYLGEEIPVVAVDHKMGGRLAAEVLLRNGCKRILHFRSTAEKESLYHDRHAEFQKIMDEQGIETYCYDLDWRRLDIQYYHQVAEEVMEKNLKFDGVFGVDRLAIECMNGLLRQHKKIPEEVKIVSYDGTYITELVEPQISTIVQPIDRMAEESVKSLCELINGKKVKNKKSILIPEFRKGGTTV